MDLLQYDITLVMIY